MPNDTLLGQRFGKLTVIAQAPSNNGRRMWQCRCDCGATHTVSTANLRSGHTTNCGCGKSPDLSGKTFGRLTVLSRSEKRAPRGKRTTPLWECRCSCGAITYKATDTLKNPAECMCADCATKSNAAVARENAGFVAGTQLPKIREMTLSAANTSGVRGVYYEKSTGKWRARLKFKGKLMNFGAYASFEDAVNARREAEQQIFGEFLEQVE